jgi:hypothetical protein
MPRGCAGGSPPWRDLNRRRTKSFRLPPYRPSGFVFPRWSVSDCLPMKNAPAAILESRRASRQKAAFRLPRPRARAQDSGLTLGKAKAGPSVSEDFVGVGEYEPKPICGHGNHDG